MLQSVICSISCHRHPERLITTIWWFRIWFWRHYLFFFKDKRFSCRLQIFL